MCQDSHLYPILLPGGQYARGWVSHQAKDIVVAPGEPFFTANGSYFVFCGLVMSCEAGQGEFVMGLLPRQEVLSRDL